MQPVIRDLSEVRESLAENPVVPTKAAPKEPREPSEWQTAANLAALFLLMRTGANYGCGEIKVDVARCEKLLGIAKRSWGIDPRIRLF
jgi:hypothetical protein